MRMRSGSTSLAHRTLPAAHHWVLAGGLVAAAMIGAARADEACARFTWDVSHERALFAGEAQALQAGRLLAAAPILTTNRLYQLKRAEQSEVSFTAAPAKKMLTDGAWAGMARLGLEHPGVYRIALDQGLWIDVLAHGVPLQSRDFQGAPGCKAPHKIVEYDLPAGTPLVLQLSGGSGPQVQVTLTPAPAAAAAPTVPASTP